MNHELGLYEPAQLDTSLPGYPLEYFQLEDSLPGVFAEMHWHTCNEILYIESGQYNVIAGGGLYRLEAQELLHIPAKSPHTTILPSGTQAVLHVLKYEPSLLLSQPADAAELSFLRPLLQEPPPGILHFSATQTACASVPDLVARMAEEIQKQESGYFYAARNLLCTLALGLVRESRRSGLPFSNQPQPRPTEVDTLFPVFAFIENNYTQPILMEDLLKICNRSYSNFAVKFKKICGKSPKEYIHHVRIHNAKILLKTSSLSIAEVASRCGFDDPSYFARVFRRSTGATPAEYRSSSQ